MALSTDDMVAIQQLVSRYAHALDLGDAEALTAMFTPDGSCWTGPDGEVRRGADMFRDTAKNTVVGRLWHFIANLVIEGDGDKATGKAYLHMVRELGREPMIAKYDFEFVKVDGRWLIAYRGVDGVPRIRRGDPA